MPRLLTPAQRELVGENIAREVRLKRSALLKRRAGMRLTKAERLRARRSRKQIIRIGFEKAREEDPTIRDFV